MAEDIDNTGQQTPASSRSATGDSSGQSQSSGPVGSGNYEVQQGDCIESIASDHGHFWGTIWNHPNNQQLKQKRKNPNILLAGDNVFVPDLRIKQESGPAETRHRFRRKGVPSKVQIVLKDKQGNPRPNLDYVMEIDGQLAQGKTDGQGKVEHPILPNAQKGRLIVGNEGEEYDLNLGNMDPVTEITGVQSRLENLGFNCEVTGKLDDTTKQAIRAFQKKHALKETGEPDDPTRQKLEQEHGS